jgi:virulence-associated protein VagC
MQTLRREAMKKNKILAIGAFILLFLIPSFALSKSQYQYIRSPKTDFYFGHISYTEVKNDGKDPMVIREGEEKPEIAVLNLPLIPGDTIRTPEGRRCEIQFDTGTIIRLDFATELKIETIMANSLSTKNKISNLLLNKGQIYIQYKRYSRPEIFQIVTPNAAIKLKHKTVAMVKAREDGKTDIHMRFGEIYVLYGPDENSLEGRTIKKSGELTISKDQKLVEGEYEDYADFESWNMNMNENFEELHQGKNFIPAPIQNLPPAVFYFAQKYSTLYGEWVWNSLYGYVWRPFLDRYYPGGNWQPFYYGQWRELNGELFWVPEESWGWVPYHLGFWFWDEKLGWLWRPGSTFAPAWVVWDFYFGDYSWRPWSPLDWMFYDFYGWNYGYSYNWLYPLYSGYYTYPGGPGMPDQSAPKAITSIRKDQLKKKDTSTTLTLPKEFNNVYKRMVTAFNKGDARVIAPLKKIPQSVIGVKKDELNAPRIHEKAVRVFSSPLPIQKESIPQKPIKNPYQEAVNTFRVSNMRARVLQDVAMSVFEGPKAGKKTSTEIAQPQLVREGKADVKEERMTVEKGALSRRGGESAFYVPVAPKPVSPAHFRDWNPDSWVARAARVSIHYVSRNNEIRCPELNLSSVNVRGSHNMTTMTGISPMGSGGGGGVSYSGGGSSSSAGGSSSDSSSGQSSGSGSSGGSSSGGKVKDK